MVFQHVGLLWIIENKKHLKFEINVQGSLCMDKGTDRRTKSYLSVSLGLFFRVMVRVRVRVRVKTNLLPESEDISM